MLMDEKINLLILDEPTTTWTLRPGWSGGAIENSRSVLLFVSTTGILSRSLPDAHPGCWRTGKSRISPADIKYRSILGSMKPVKPAVSAVQEAKRGA